MLAFVLKVSPNGPLGLRVPSMWYHSHIQCSITREPLHAMVVSMLNTWLLAGVALPLALGRLAAIESLVSTGLTLFKATRPIETSASI